MRVNVYSDEPLDGPSIDSKALGGDEYIGARLEFGGGVTAVTIWVRRDDQNRKLELADAFRDLAESLSGKY